MGLSIPLRLRMFLVLASVRGWRLLVDGGVGVERGPLLRVVAASPEEEADEGEEDDAETDADADSCCGAGGEAGVGG